MITLLNEIRLKKDALEVLAERYGISNIRVFGSVLRGEETPTSDIDLLIEIEKGRSLRDFCAFRLGAMELLKRDVDLVQSSTLHPLLKDRIVTEAKPL